MCLRLLSVLVTLFLIASTMFLWTRVVPDSPLGLALPHDPRYPMTQEEFQEILNDYSQPLVVQYPGYVGRMLSGGFLDSQSYTYQEHVGDILYRTLPFTLFLFSVALTVSVIVGMALGAIIGNTRRPIVEKTFSFIWVLLLSLPGIMLTYLFFQLFVAEWHWLPTGGYLPAGESFTPMTSGKIWEFAKHSILPLSTLLIPSIGGSLLVFTGCWRHVGHEIRSSRATGQATQPTGGRWIATMQGIGKGIPNLQLLSGFVLGMVILTEVSYTYRGAGWMLAYAIHTIDLHLAEGCFFMLTLILVFSNLTYDLLFTYLPNVLRHPVPASRPMTLSSGPTIPGPMTVDGDITSKNFLGQIRDIAVRYIRSPVGVLALVIFISMVVIAIIGPSMYSYSAISWFQGDIWRGFLDGAGAPVLAVVIVSIMVGAIGVFGGLLSGFVGRSLSYPVALLADFALAMPFLAMIGFRAMADGTVNLFWTLFTLGFYASAAAIFIVRDGVLMSKRRIQSSNPQFKGTGAMRIRLVSLLPATLARTMYVVKFAVVAAIGTVIVSDFLGFSDWGSWGSIESDAFEQSVFLTGDWGWVLLPSICIFLTTFSSYLMFDKLERILAEKFPD